MLDPVGESKSKAEMRACSACAGDYEDPDRTAWAADETDAEEREEPRRKSTEDFPAQELNGGKGGDGHAEISN